MWIAGIRIKRPSGSIPLVKANQQSLGGIVALSERPPALPLTRPAHVKRALAVTGFASDADFRPFRIEAIASRIVVLVHAGRMALGTHEVPVLVQFSPMQDVVVAY